MSHLIHFLIILMLGCLAPELDNFCKYPEMGHLKTSLAPAEEQSASVGLGSHFVSVLLVVQEVGVSLICFPTCHGSAADSPGTRFVTVCWEFMSSSFVIFVECI